MPIETPLKMLLQTEIASAFDKAKNSGTQQGADSSSIIQQLSRDITEAIDKYVKGAVVTVTVSPGQVVATPAGPGTTSSPGFGKS
jgi:hypothetical protein